MALSRPEAAKLAISVFLNNFSVDQVLEGLNDVRAAWRAIEPDCSLEDNPAVILLTGTLLHRTTGIFVMTDDTASNWLEACQEIADSGQKTSA